MKLIHLLRRYHESTSKTKYRNMEYGAKSLVIGLDLGGTNSVFGIIDREGKVLTTISIKTQGYQNVEAYVEDSVKAVMQIVEQVGGMEKIHAMG